MKSVNQIYISENLKKLCNLFKSKAELFIVGGYVRNSLLKIETSDIDLCSKLKIEEIVELLKNTDFEVEIKSEILGTVCIKCQNESYEHSTFRKEFYSKKGQHQPSQVVFVDSVHEDATRRDFSINSIYYSITKSKIIDIYGALADIKIKTLKTIETPSFVLQNDGLRILRMIRFAVELNFKIDSQTMQEAVINAKNIMQISSERKLCELNKILNCSNKYSITAKDALKKAICLLNEVDAFKFFHTSTSMIKANLCLREKKDIFLALLIDITATVNPFDKEFYLNFMLGAKGLNLDKKTKNFYIKVICGYFDALKGVKNKQFFFAYFEEFDKIGQMLKHKNLKTFEKYNFFYKYIKNHNVPILVKNLAICGKDIKNANSKLNQENYGKVLNKLLNLVFDGKIDNTKQALLEEVKKYDNTNH